MFWCYFREVVLRPPMALGNVLDDDERASAEFRDASTTGTFMNFIASATCL